MRNVWLSVIFAGVLFGCSSDSAQNVGTSYNRLTVGSTVYNNGSLGSGWIDGSWATHKLAATTPLYDGQKTFTATFGAWTGVLFARSTGVTGNDAIRLYVYGGANTTSPAIYFQLEINGKWGTNDVLVANYCDGGIQTNAWTSCTIPFSAVGASASSNVTSILLAEESGKAWKLVAFSTIQLVQTDQGAGGASTGGSPATGGLSTGGNATGGVSTGGTPATGGALATGGTPATGGDQSTGGVSTGGVQATGGAPATGGVSTGGTPATGGSQGTGVTTYIPPKYLPSVSDGVPTTAQWLHCGTMIVKDNLGGDLITILRGNNTIHAAVSTNDGDSWAWVNPTSNIDIDPPSAIAQSSDGNVHLISWSWSRGVSYARVVLSRDTSGHINGLSAGSSRVSFPISIDFADMGADLIAGTDLSGNPTLIYTIYDNNTSGGGRVLAGKTTPAAGVLPTASSDFVALDNSAGATVLDMTNSDSWAAPHNAGSLIAQHPISKDVWIQWGPFNTWDGLTQNKLPLKRLRATPSGTGFAVGTSQTIATFNGTGVQNYEVVSTPTSVWFLYGTPVSALNFDKAEADGTVLQNAVLSPYTLSNYGGFFTASFNETTNQIWLMGQAGWDTGDPHMKETWAKYWDGTSWSSYTTITLTGEPLFRIARSSGWNGGLAFMQNHLDYNSWRPVIGILRTN